MTYQLILASASHRRLDLMCQIGIKPDKINPPEIDENPIKNEMPGALALRLAKEKATKVASSNSNCFIIAADTLCRLYIRLMCRARCSDNTKVLPKNLLIRLELMK